MFKSICSLAVFVLLVSAPAALAVDLDSLSASDRRIYCYVYVSVDLSLREEAGLIDRAQVTRDRMRMSSAIYRREGNLSGGRYEARARRAFQTIAKEDPTSGQIAAQAATCRALFRI